MIKKGIKYILILFIMLSCSTVYAAGVAGSGGYISSGGGSGKTPEGNKEIKFGDLRYRCTYNYSITPSVSVTANAYNIDGDSMFPKTFETDMYVKAGTWVGINAIEEKSVSWNITKFRYEKIVAEFTCEYEYPAHPEEKYNCFYVNPWFCDTLGIGCDCVYTIWVPTQNTTRTKEWPYYYKEFTEADCPEVGENWELTKFYRSGEKSETVDKNDSGAKQCKTDVLKEMINGALNSIKNPSNKLEILNTNEYPTGNEEQINKKLKEVTKTINPTLIDSKMNGSYESETGSASSTFGYFPKKVCIDAKTAKVYYDNDCHLEKEEIYEIKNKTVHDKYLGKNVNTWPYFIPLNTKTDSKFYLNLVENGSLDAGICLDIMKNYSNYVDLLKPISGGSFLGDYNRLKNSSSDYKKVTKEKGCNFAARINFKIEQKFYDEEMKKDKLLLKGFSFYYRPIDITNPFPNEIDKNSYWYDWNKAKTKTPNLTKSFNEVTYVAHNIDIDKIRTYNQNNKYTNWKGIKITGISEFIEQNDIIIRNSKINKDSLYNLGCGPYNEDWEECKRWNGHSLPLD